MSDYSAMNCNNFLHQLFPAKPLVGRKLEDVMSGASTIQCARTACERMKLVLKAREFVVGKVDQTPRRPEAALVPMQPPPKSFMAFGSMLVEETKLGKMDKGEEIENHGVKKALCQSPLDGRPPNNTLAGQAKRRKHIVGDEDEEYDANNKKRRGRPTKKSAKRRKLNVGDEEEKGSQMFTKKEPKVPTLLPTPLPTSLSTPLPTPTPAPPPTPSPTKNEVIVDKMFDDIPPEDNRILKFLKRGFKDTLSKNASTPGVSFSLALSMNLDVPTLGGVTFPLVANNIKCVSCDDKFNDILVLHKHILDNHQQGINIKGELIKRNIKVRNIKKECIKPEPTPSITRYIIETSRELRPRRNQIKKEINVPDNEATSGTTMNVKVEKMVIGDGVVTSPARNQPSRLSFQCDVCKRRMNTSVALLSHIERLHPCVEIPKPVELINVVAREDQVKSEVVAQHNPLHNDGNERICCEFCTKSYKHKQSLRAHIKAKHAEHYAPGRRGVPVKKQN